MPSIEPSALRIAAVLIAGAGLLFLVCFPTNPHTELALATREAIQLARDAGSSAESAALWSGRFRLLAVAGGVTIPLVIAYLIWRSSAQSDLDPAEVIDLVERLELSDRSSQPPQPLVANSNEALPSQTTDDPTD